MKKAVKILNSLEDYILAVMLLIMTVLAFVNVVARYVFLASLPWIEELNRLGLVIISYAGAGFMDSLYTTPVGRVVAAFGLVIFIISFIFAKKFSKIEL